MHKPLIQHNCQQIKKKQNEIWRNIIKLIWTLAFGLDNSMAQTSERYKSLQLISPITLIIQCSFEEVNQFYLSLKSYWYRNRKIIWCLNVIALSNSYKYLTGLDLTVRDSWFTMRFWIFTTEFFVIAGLFTTR